MKKIKIIPFIISLLFPLVCTSFVVCYSYGVNDIYTNNKEKYEVYFQNKYFDDKGAAIDELTKAVKLDSYKYQISPNNVNFFDGKFQQGIYSGTDLTAALFAYTVHQTKQDEDGDDYEAVDIAYTLYLYDILYKNKYTNATDYVNSDGILLNSLSTLNLIYVKGTGDLAEMRLEDAVNEVRADGTTSKGTVLTASTTGVYDNEAEKYKGEEKDEIPYVYRLNIFNSESTTTDFTNFEDLEDIYGDEYTEVGEGYTFSLVNMYNNGTATIAVKQIATFELSDLTDAKTFEKSDDVLDGYRSDYSLAGYTYIGYIWPTLLWQGALTLVLTGVLAVLFYAIWQTEPEVSTEQANIRKLQKDRKQVNKKKKKK